MTSPQPSGPAVGRRGSGIWILAAMGCLGVGGVVLAAGIFLAGVLSGLREEPPAPVAASGGSTTAGPAAVAPPGANGPDDFIYHSPNGLIYVAEHRVSAEGVSVALIGEWREDHRHVVLRLREGGRYELAAGGGALSGRTLSDLVASNSAEQGTWTFENGTLTLTPAAYDLSGIAERRSNSGSGKADAPRAWAVVGVTIDYTPQGQEVVKQRPGLRVRGPGPSWYYPPGEWDWVLRSAW